MKKPSKTPAKTARPAAPDGGVARLRLSAGKKLAFATVAVVLGLTVLEGLLALVGVHPERFEQDPYVGFSTNLPLFVAETNPDGRVTRVTARNRLAFFNPQRFQQPKATGTFRIFSLGGSTTYGHPYDDATSFNGWLRAYLQGLAPGRNWEAINAGGISYGSYRVANLMQELIRYQPDLFVVYTGHNEFLERRLYGKVTRPSPFARAIQGVLSRFRVTTLLKAVLLHPKAAAEPTPTPNTNLLEADPVTLLEDVDGPLAYRRSELQREQVLAHFEFNLDRMIDIAQSVGAGILFITPASNLRDASPFKSELREDLDETARRRWKELYDQARQDLAAGRSTNALATLAQAAAIDDLPAGLHFVRGRVLEKLGRFTEARSAYERARDEDVCPLRAVSAVRAALERVTKARKAPLIDFEHMQAARSENGIPGGATFLDHVHPTIEGYRLLALEILRTMEKERLVQPQWDAAAIDRVTDAVNSRIDSRAQALALMNLCKTLGWAGKREEAYRASVRAVETGPNIAAVRSEAGLAALLSGRTNEAVVHYRRAIELDPRLADAQGALGVILEEQGQTVEAITHYQLALRHSTPKSMARNQRNLTNALQKLQSP